MKCNITIFLEGVLIEHEADLERDPSEALEIISGDLQTIASKI